MRDNRSMDVKIEVIGVPVTDVDRAIAFYVEQVGFTLDHDHKVSDEVRFVQITPPGSACSIAIGKGISPMEPGTQKGIQVVVEDVEAFRTDVGKRGVETTEVDKMPWGWFTFFRDPDGNAWTVQQMPPQETPPQNGAAEG
jgi:predicted enzyme related to lactoylglutathione lyase